MKIKTGKSILIHSFMIVLGFFMIYPILWMVFSSFNPLSEIFSTPGLIPENWTLENYIDGWAGIGGITFTTFFKNSFIVSISVVIGSLFIASITGFAFARFKFKLRNILFSFVIITLMLPIQIVIVPQYVIFNNMGWVDTFLPLIVPSF